MIPFLAQTAVFFLLLERWPVLGSVSGESKLAVAVACAVVASAVLMLAWDALAAPARVHRDVMSNSRSQHDFLNEVFDAERKTRLLALMHEDGMRLYKTKQEPTQYFQSMDDWVVKTENTLKKMVSASELFRFQDRANNITMFCSLEMPCDADWESETQEILR